MSKLFRIHIRPRSGTDDLHATFQHCLEHGLLGVGWRVDEFAQTADWEAYERAASSVHKSLQQPSYIYRNVERGDLVWTRDPDGQYYLARVTSGWEYWTSDDSREKDIDIGNIFRCDFRKVASDKVPRKVASSFQRGHSIQKIADASAQEDSWRLWNEYTVTRCRKIGSDDPW